MNFDDTPAEAAFRAEVRAWIDANAPQRAARPTWSRRVRQPGACKGVDTMAASKAWQKKKAEAGWACLHWPKEYGGRGATPIERVIWGQEEGPLWRAGRHLHHRPRHVRADHDGLRLRGAEAPLPAAAGGGRGDLVPAVLRTGRRLRSRRPAHPGRARAGRVGRLDHQRPEDLDQRRPLFRLRHPDHPHRPDRAQAQGPDHVLPEHEDPGDRDPPDQAGQRPVRLQRGLFHRRAPARRPAPGGGRRRLEGLADHPDERAAVDRLWHVHRLSRTL